MSFHVDMAKGVEERGCQSCPDGERTAEDPGRLTAVSLGAQGYRRATARATDVLTGFAAREWNTQFSPPRLQLGKPEASTAASGVCGAARGRPSAIALRRLSELPKRA